MKLEEQFIQIESQEFSASVNVASSLGLVCRAAREQPAVQHLWNELSSKEARLELYGRIVELCQLETDVSYENSYDAALAVYLWLLSASDPAAAASQGLGYLAAGVVLGTRRLWWAEKAAHREYDRSTFGNSSGSCPSVISTVNVYQSISTGAGASLGGAYPPYGEIGNIYLAHPAQFGTSGDSYLVNATVETGTTYLANSTIGMGNAYLGEIDSYADHVSSQNMLFANIVHGSEPILANTTINNDKAIASFASDLFLADLRG